MGYTFNGVSKTISLVSVTTLNLRDLWSRWIERVDTGDNSKYSLAFSTVGGNPIDVSSGTSIPIYIFLDNGRKIKPMESNHTLKITNGILVDSSGGDPFINTTGSFIVRINYQQPVQAITVNTGGGGGGGGDTKENIYDYFTSDSREIPFRTPVTDIVEGVWNEGLPSSYPTDSAGDKLGNITKSISGSASLNKVADSFVLTTGIETNSYTDTQLLNGVSHRIDDVSNDIDCYYVFNVGTDGIPVGMTVNTNLQSGNDTINVYYWNFNTSSRDSMGVIPGTGSSRIDPFDFILTESSVGKGLDSGEVRIRFETTGGSNPRLDIDFIYVSYAYIQRTSQITGVLQGGSINTAILPLSASNIDDYYKPALIILTSGAGQGQSRRIDSYVGSTRVAMVATDWKITPNNTTTFSIVPRGSVRVSDIDQQVIDDINKDIKKNTNLIPALL